MILRKYRLTQAAQRKKGIFDGFSRQLFFLLLGAGKRKVIHTTADFQEAYPQFFGAPGSVHSFVQLFFAGIRSNRLYIPPQSDPPFCFRSLYYRGKHRSLQTGPDTSIGMPSGKISTKTCRSGKYTVRCRKTRGFVRIVTLR